MATSRLGDVIDALVTLLRAETGFRAPDTESDDIPVYDGPEASEGDMHTEPRLVIVGYSPAGGAATFEQVGVTMAAGTRPRDETGTVYFSLIVNNGDTVAAARAAVLEMCAPLETLVRTNPDLGLGSASGFRWISSPTAADLSQTAHPNGCTAQIDLSLTYTARL